MRRRRPPPMMEGAFATRSPDGIRTRATALRGRRARPLHNGAVDVVRTDQTERRDREITGPNRRSPNPAGVPGLEPRLTEPESVGLPITPYPKGIRRLSARVEKRLNRLRTVEEDSVPPYALPNRQVSRGTPPEIAGAAALRRGQAARWTRTTAGTRVAQKSRRAPARKRSLASGPARRQGRHARSTRSARFPR